MTRTAKFVKQSREALGLSQDEFGKLVGRDRRSIIRYEQGWELPIGINLAIQQLIDTAKKRKKK